MRLLVSSIRSLIHWIKRQSRFYVDPNSAQSPTEFPPRPRLLIMSNPIIWATVPLIHKDVPPAERDAILREWEVKQRGPDL